MNNEISQKQIWDQKEYKLSRKWAMPNPNTFSIKPIDQLLRKYITPKMTVIDAFARDSQWGTITNDLNPASLAQYNLGAVDFLDKLIADGVRADVVLLDPPYSPRQISECYKSFGLECTTRDTQNARLYKACKDRMTTLLKSSGIAICFGWNSGGFGKTRKFRFIEILIIAHGGAHNDTICTVEKKRTK